MAAPRTHFHPLLRILHWTMAAMILAMLFIGIAMVSTAGPAYPLLLKLHRPIGIAILLLVVIRLILRLATGAPPLPGDMPRWQMRAARFSHVLLYLAAFALPVIGWAMLSAGGFPVQVAKGLALPPILPHDIALYGMLRLAHMTIALLFFALILGHLAAGLFHAFIRRDGVFRSMSWGRAPAG